VHNYKCIPTYHPAYVLRDYEQRHITTHDLRRARRNAASPDTNGTKYNFLLRPSYATVDGYLRTLLAKLSNGPLVLAHDIETRAGHIACLGIATSATEAICIPFMCLENKEGYWNATEEFAIIKSL